MAVKFFALDGKEDITCLRRPRIGAGIFNFQIPRAGSDFGVAGVGDEFQRAFFHKNYFSKNVAVTTAVMVFWREVVSFIPSPLVSLLCSGVI